MIISLNWIKKYTDIDISIDELTALIGERLVEIEGVEYIGDKYKDVIVARVVSAQPLEGSDHLNVVMIDDGRIVDGIERDEQGYVQVVCGAPNVSVDTFVAWLPPRSTVPVTYSDDEPFVLSAKPLRGVMSNGMLASAKELDLYDDHSGILILDADVKPGDSFATVYELDDYIIDIENKSLTHRPDAFGVIGFAREIAGIQGKAFHSDHLASDELVSVDGERIAVSIEDDSLSKRTQVVVLEREGLARQTPILMQTYLARSGVRPVSPIVDVTNYIMLTLGQPVHAYDYDKFLNVSGGVKELNVRRGREGEILTLLDERVAQLGSEDIVIAAGAVPVGLAGAMGGSTTAVDESTKTVLLEVATFDLYNLRATQMRQGIFSEAITRFTKGIPASTGTLAMAEAVRLMGDVAGFRCAGPIVDEYLREDDPKTVQVTTAQINEVLGTQFAAADIDALLENVEFSVRREDDGLAVAVPEWRQDISIPEDVIEEVGRLAGFDTIPFALPKRSATAVTPQFFDEVRSLVRRNLVSAGANEVLTYSFIHEDTMRRTGQEPDDAYKIINSISPELQRYRQSITPNLLGHIHPNIKAGYNNFALFELNKVHDKTQGLTDEGVPVERDMLAFVISEKTKTAMYYRAKQYLDFIATKQGVQLQYAPLEEGLTAAEVSPFEPKRAATVRDAESGRVIGVVGEYRKAVQGHFKIATATAGFEIDMQYFAGAVKDARSKNTYKALSKYPGTERDICFKVADNVQYAFVEDAVRSALSDTDFIWNVSPVDIYRVEGDSYRNITVRVSLGSYDRTLTGEEISNVYDTVIQYVTDKTGGEVV